MMKKILLLPLLGACAFAGVTVKHDGTTLGEPRVYHSYKGETKVALTVMRLGKREDRRVLISYEVPGHTFHKKSFVYEEKCETTKCHKIFFTQQGGSSINLISNDGYYGKNYEALLPGEQNKIHLYYDDTLSKKKSRTILYSQHMASIHRNHSLDETKVILEEGLSNIAKLCQSSPALENNIEGFTKEKSLALLGMGKPILDQIAVTCKEPLYKEVLSMIRKITFAPAKTYKPMKLTKMNELIVYISPDIYNPEVQTKTALDKL